MPNRPVRVPRTFYHESEDEEDTSSSPSDVSFLDDIPELGDDDGKVTVADASTQPTPQSSDSIEAGKPKRPDGRIRKKDDMSEAAASLSMLWAGASAESSQAPIVQRKKGALGKLFSGTSNWTRGSSTDPIEATSSSSLQRGFKAPKESDSSLNVGELSHEEDSADSQAVVWVQDGVEGSAVETPKADARKPDATSPNSTGTYVRGMTLD